MAGPAAIIEVAKAADRLGYSSVWAMDRLLAPVAPRTPYPASPDGELPDEQRIVLDPLGVLTLAAAVTERVRLGTGVLVAPWYAPALLARSLTTLDHISSGRLTVGLGLGWSVDEYEAVGVPQRRLGNHSEEILDVLEAIWTDEVVSYDGDRYHIASSTIMPKPVQNPRPPLLLAAYTPAGFDRIARRADGWMPAGLPVAAIAPMWATIRDLAAGHGREPDDMQLVVRANVKIFDEPLGNDRPSYWGSMDQVAEDIEATRSTGAKEIVIDVQSNAGSASELIDLTDGLLSPILASV
ncbi:MAG TPA: LLM class F420-dependent oxidoreductase [Ilumatobacteraceae bacterium]